MGAGRELREGGPARPAGAGLGAGRRRSLGATLAIHCASVEPTVPLPISVNQLPSPDSQRTTAPGVGRAQAPDPAGIDAGAPCDPPPGGSVGPRTVRGPGEGRGTRTPRGFEYPEGWVSAYGRVQINRVGGGPY